MKTRLCLMLAALVAALAAVPAFADDGDRARLSATTTLIGQQTTLTLELHVPPGATVEVDRAAASWNGVEVVSIVKSAFRDQGGQSVATLELIVAPFVPGEQQFAPAVNIIHGADVQPRQLPLLSWTVSPTVKPSDPNELSPLASPDEIDGAESPLLRPAIALGGVLAAAAVALATLAVVHRMRSRPRKVLPEVPEAEAEPDLGVAERLLEHDPVAAYRALAAVVRAVITRRHDLPAYALTTGELRRRMESSGIDRWQARLVGGLLEECDAVVYAGYRPALERRHADLTMAREIVEGAA